MKQTREKPRIRYLLRKSDGTCSRWNVYRLVLEMESGARNGEIISLGAFYLSGGLHEFSAG